MNARIPLLLMAWSWASPLLTAHAVTMTELLETNGIPAPVAYVTNATPEQVLYPFSAARPVSGEKRPALVLIHGGGWRGGDPSVFFPAAKYFASRGLPSFSIGYRLVGPGTNDPSVSDCLADCRAALRYLRSHASEYGIDPERIAVLGDSAGGHLAACLGTIPDPQDAPGVSSAANLMIPCNPIVDLGPGEGNTNTWFRLIQKGQAMEKNPAPEALVPTPEQISLAASVSPIAFVSGKSAPSLLIHGLDDTVVSPDQSRRLDDALRKAGVPSELVLVPGARHAFILPRYTATEAQVDAAMTTVDRFLVSRGYLNGTPTLEVSQVPAWTPKPRPSPGKPQTSSAH